jgi:ABC-2 type transport system ATP-binding protein|nr:ABC transporter ATP-binding protein [Kofleriaceae bacterium]
MGSLLELRGVSRAFGERRAVRETTLAVARGEAVLLVGRNGAGKTTLLRLATGFLDCDAGEVVVDGIAMARERTRAQARLGYLPEQATAPAELAVDEHLWSRARLKGLARGAVAAAVDRVVEAAALGDVRRRRIGVLSKGFRQRVGLADALLGDPPLLVLDEPTSGMDPIQVRELRDRLAAAAADRAVIVSSHAVTDLESLATRVAVVVDGAVVADAPPAELRRGKETLEQAVVRLMGPGAS